MIDSLFKPHGSYTFRWLGDVMVSQWIGTFNNEAMTNYVQEMKRQISDRPTTPWGRIVDLRKWDGMTPDVSEQFNELAIWLRTTSCVLSVQVFSEQFYQTLAAKVANRVAAPNLEYTFDMQAAFDFMKKSGLNLGDSDLHDLL